MADIALKDLYGWCSIPAEALERHPALKLKFRILKDSLALGELMARELADGIIEANRECRPLRVIIPCGPKCWYEPFTRMINDESVSMRSVTVFHMDECLDWQGRTLPAGDPYNFRSFMERWFYGGICAELAVPVSQRYFPEPSKIELIQERFWEAPIDMTIGGWGQDGHVAYNQARRHPFSHITLEQLRNCEIRIQENNLDTIMALAQRSFGGAYQFVPPMSITLGLKECMSAKKVRVYSDTGSWKQTALRVALFSEPTVEYPMTLLQEHPDIVITATLDTARHPISENPDWEFRGVNA